MKSQGSALLLRPSAIEGESISSWRQRVGWENGYRLFPVAAERTRRADPDTGQNEDDLNWVAALHGTSDTEISAMTLRRFVGILVTRLASRSQPRWWLRARYGAPTPNFGPMFCPTCLEEDKIPHFRLIWRIGFLTVCSVHSRQLLDHCSRCGSAPWPSGCGRKTKVHPLFQSLRYCWHCGESLCEQPQPLIASSPLFLVDLLDVREVRVGQRLVPAYEALSVLRAICQLFLRNRSRVRIESSSTHWSTLCKNLSENAKGAQFVEHLRVDDRALILAAAVEMLSDWPDAFVRFAKRTGISKAHFDGAYDLHPEWMSEIIDTTLAKQNRLVTAEVLEMQMRKLRQDLGRPPTKTELRRSLGWQGDKGLHLHFPTAE